MVKQITLDGIKRSGINIWKEDGKLRVEANYSILSGNEVVRAKSMEITGFLASEQKATISQAYDAIFSGLEQRELS